MTNKRVLSALAIGAVALVVAACGGSGESTTSSASSTPTGTTPGATTVAPGGGDFLDGGFAAKETPVKGGRLTIAYD